MLFLSLAAITIAIAIAIAIGLVATLHVAKSLAEPLTAMRRALGQVEAGDLPRRCR